MARSTLEHRKGVGGMAQVCKNATTRRGRQPGVSLFLRGGDEGSTNFWIVVLGALGRNGNGGGEHPCGVTMTDNGESGKTVGRPVIGDNGIQGSAMSSGDAVVATYTGHCQTPVA